MKEMNELLGTEEKQREHRSPAGLEKSLGVKEKPVKG
jgi:hypothetical protein